MIGGMDGCLHDVCVCYGLFCCATRLLKPSHATLTLSFFTFLKTFPTLFSLLLSKLTARPTVGCSEGGGDNNSGSGVGIGSVAVIVAVVAVAVAVA
jgi:hypothetical protein